MRKAWVVVLIVAILGQTAFLLREYALPWGWRVKQVWDHPRVLRSADMSLGAQAARAVEFINQTVPEQSALLLPPEGAPVRFALKRSMQYFFFPRTVIECGTAESERCAEALAQPDTYVLATEGFPPETALRGRAFLPAPDTGLDWFTGIYGPAFPYRPVAEGVRWPEMLLAGLGDLGLILALSVLGGAVLLAIQRPWAVLEAAALALPLGAGILTWAIFLSSWAGVRISLASATIAFLLLLAVFGALARRSRMRHPAQPALEGSLAGLRGSAPRLLLAAAAAGLVLLAVGLAVGISYRLYDPVQIWSVKGYGISLEGTILAAERWGEHGLSYPLNLPLQVALFHLLDGDLLPGSKLLYPIFGLCLCLVLFSFLRRQGADWLGAGLGALLLGTVPIVFFHSVEGFANLHFTFYLAAGILWGVQGAHSDSPRTQWLAGLLLGLAAWTRPEGVAYSLGAPLVLLVATRITRQGRAALVPLCAPTLLMGGAWFAFTLSGAFLRGSQQDQVVSAAASDILAGRIDLRALWVLISTFAREAFIPVRAMFPAISATAWGALFPVLLAAFVAHVPQLRPRVNPQRFSLLLQWLFVAAANGAIFYLQSYGISNYTAFIERAFPRSFLPTAVLMIALALWLLSSRADGRPSAS